MRRDYEAEVMLAFKAVEEIRSVEIPLCDCSHLVFGREDIVADVTPD